MPIPLGILAVAGAGAGGGNSFDLLETTVLSSTATSVTFSSLDSYSSYKHLHFRITARDNIFGTTRGISVRLNADSGNNYAWHQLRGNGSAVQVEAGATTNTGYIGLSASNDATANIFGASVIDLLDFSSTNKTKTLRSLSGATTNSTSSIRLSSTLWNSTSAVTSVTFRTEDLTSSFVAGSRFSLYGIK